MIKGINEILKENTTLTTAIGGAEKIFPMVVSESVQPPFIASSLARSGAENTKDAVAGLDYPLVNINVHAQGYDELETVCEAVRNALDGIGGTTNAGYTFSKIWFSNAFDRPDLFTPERPLYARSIQFTAIIKR
jgi:hypothetical protein